MTSEQLQGPGVVSTGVDVISDLVSLNHRYTAVHGKAIDMAQRTFKACMVVAAAILSLMTVYWYSNIYDWYKTSSLTPPPTPRSDRPHQLSHPASKRSDLWVDVNPNENTLVSNTQGTLAHLVESIPQLGLILNLICCLS